MFFPAERKKEGGLSTRLGPKRHRLPSAFLTIPRKGLFPDGEGKKGRKKGFREKKRTPAPLSFAKSS